MTSMTSDKSSQSAWEKFRHGDHNTTEELEAMEREIVVALPFLQHHTQMGAANRAAILDLSTIQQNLFYRENGELPSHIKLR